MEQTKGYLRLKGKIWGLNTANEKTNDKGSMRSLSFKLNTSKDNSLFIQVGKWVNSPLNVKIKGRDMEKPEEFAEQEAIDKIKELFKDGDSVYVNCRADINVYSKRIDYLVSQIYIEKDSIDFNSEEFQEINELNMPVIITEKPNDGEVKAGVVNYYGEMFELDLSLSDKDVNNYFVENVKVGDLIKTTIEVINKPNYVDGVTESSKERKTLKGKTIGGSNNQEKRKIDGYISKLEIVDVDIEKSESRKYERNEIREALDKVNNRVTKESTNDNLRKEDDDNDLPF